MNHFKKYLLVVIAFVLGALSVGFVSAHGGDLALIHGCYKNTNGSLRIVTATTNCDTNETTLDWNIQGVQGPAGSPGPSGPPGPSGAPGSSESPISAGGGLTGRWEGFLTYSSDPGCNQFPPAGIQAVFVEDSADNLSGTFGVQQIEENDEGEIVLGYFDYRALIGKSDEPQVAFSIFSSQQTYEATLTDENNMSGVLDTGTPICQPSWSMQRVPLIP